MDRRAAIARLIAMTGMSVVGAEAFLTGCRPEKRARTPFTPADVATLDEIGETILPTTDTPGAKAAGIGAFMTVAVNDCYDDRSHDAFTDGLRRIDELSRSRHGKTFVQCSPAERTALLEDAHRDERAYAKAQQPNTAPHYFRLMRELTLLGYFTSEIGATKALRYVETPGSYDGNVAYHPGDRAWVNPMHRF
jgi:glucoside 3-dehydrogenase (cytochrome c) hitch-hiker subunit